MEKVTLQVPVEMLHVGAEIARERDITLGQLVRDLLADEISRRKNVRPPNRADERLIAPLRARLAADFSSAHNWHDLHNRLQAKGYRLHAAGGGLAVHRHPDGQRLCKASELGFGHSRLVERFRAGFPGHAHSWVEARVLNATAPGTGPDADLVIEP
ncbi:hypothetical protein [Pseudaestuariivita atlantica]|uniref:Uncharacterized protein n=1 Tax=Pseudaestuariivita atlantica TaxID=1317121 RepID=A0A0L1JSG1_9RHOB|nr:hypothetical protein [Pseudaestuariivita atlantica]KNG94333.1 hypothetical protein ATO11_09035 [Pseudaestuariivita atlantica]